MLVLETKCNQAATNLMIMGEGGRGKPVFILKTAAQRLTCQKAQCRVTATDFHSSITLDVTRRFKTSLYTHTHTNTHQTLWKIHQGFTMNYATSVEKVKVVCRIILEKQKPRFISGDDILLKKLGPDRPRRSGLLSTIV